MHIILKNTYNQKIIVSTQFQYLLLLNKFLKFKNLFNNKIIEYTNIYFLKNFLTKYGKIIPYIETKISFKNYKKIVKAIKKARYFKLIPYTISF